MLNNNPGLREICHSITGGALAAQGMSSSKNLFRVLLILTFLGYWMPYDAAKAVAATFCYKIRYALTPVFGLDFLSLCAEPGTEGFGHMVIDHSIVRHCTDEANEYRIMSREGSTIDSPKTPASSISSRWTSKPYRMKPAKPMDVESGYGTDTDRSDKYLHSPQSTCQWTALNTPRSVTTEQYRLDLPQALPTDTIMAEGCDAPPNSPESSNSGGNSGSGLSTKQSDDEYRERSLSPPSSEKAFLPVERKRKIGTSTKEARAAYLLMRLHIADRSLQKSGFTLKRRRASS